MKELYRCTEPGCLKVYVNSAILKRHWQAFHSSTKKFQCMACHKSLASRQNLKEHSYIHTGEKPYSCTEQGCKMSFRQGTHLSAHKKMHQKGEWTLNFQRLLEKLSEFPCFDEKFGQSGQIILPKIIGPCKLSALPSLF